MMRVSFVCYAILLSAVALTGYLLLRPAERPSRYLKDDGPVVDQGKKNPEEPKENPAMSVKEFVDSTIKNNRVVIW